MESACWHFKPYFVEENGIWELRNNPVPMATMKQRADRFFIGKTYILKYLYLYVMNWYDRWYYRLRSC